ncbi:hypothetical protein D3C80_1216720 [compost metagenome]
MIPPQSPGFLSVISLLEVKTIGAVSKPSAIIFEPLVITRVPHVSTSPRIMVPGSIVNTALLVMYTTPTNV